MIDVQKVKLMTRISIYENGEGKKDIKMHRSSQGTYVTLKVIESILCITLAFVLCAGLYSMRYFSRIVTEGFAVFKSTATHLLIIYVILMILSLVMTYFYYGRKYKNAHRRILNYDKDLGRLAVLMGEDPEESDFESLEEEVEEL